MPVEVTPVEGVLILHQATQHDGRGFFRQTYVLDELIASVGHDLTFQQGNHARSGPGVIRGFHAEPWSKLVYVASGQVLGAFADLRPDSPTFGRHVTVPLGDDTERHRVFVPEGVGNAYCVVGDRPADYLYDVTAVWRPDVDKRAVRWDDPTLAVEWPVAEPVLSGDDRAAPTLRERFPDHPLFTGGA